MSRLWKKNDVAILKRMFRDTPNSEIAEALGCSYGRVANKAFSLGLRKSRKYMQSEKSGRLMQGSTVGMNGRFPKGHEPFNKGRKWSDYASPEAAKAMRRTTFRKGNRPHNTKRDGAISVRVDKAGRDYRFIRVGLSKWVHLHVYNWEKKYGRVPKNKIVVFKDRNRNNCKVSNLELITRAENMRRNTIHRYPPELKATIRTLNKLKKKISHGKKQNSRPAKSSV